MAETVISRLARSRGRDLRRGVGQQLLELRQEREPSQRELAAAAGIDRSVLARAEAGEANLTLEALASLATALGGHASIRLYEDEGPRLRDHVQVRLIDTLVERLHPRWRPRLEVPVHRPARGIVDLVLIDPQAGELASVEAHSEIRSAERLLRRSGEKTEALPSAAGWPWMARAPSVVRLLVLRSTVATRSVVVTAPALFRVAYPGRTADAVAALLGPTGSLTSSAIVWVDVRGSGSRLLEGPPRGVTVGR